METARLIVSVALVIAVSTAPGASTGQPPPDVSGTWASELGPLTLQESDGTVTGFWLTRTGRRGVVESGRVQGSSLVLEYAWPWVPVRGMATFTWNGAARRWEGSWRHTSGAVGVWNLSDRVESPEPEEQPHEASAPPEPPPEPVRPSTPPTSPPTVPETAVVVTTVATPPAVAIPTATPTPVTTVATTVATPPAVAIPAATPTPVTAVPTPLPPGVSSNAPVPTTPVPVAAPAEAARPVAAPAVPPVVDPGAIPAAAPPPNPVPPPTPSAPVAPPDPAPAPVAGSGALVLGPLVVTPSQEWALEKQDTTVIILRRSSDLAGVQVRSLGPSAGSLEAFVDRMRAQTQQFGGTGVTWNALPDVTVAGAVAKQAEIEVSGSGTPARTRQVFFDVAGARFVVSLGSDPGVYAGATPAFESLLRTIAVR